MLRTIILISFLSLIFSVTAFAQLSDEIVGKIYDKTEADELYGPVQRSFRMNTIALEKVLTRVNNFVLFKMKNDIPVIADEHRRVVFTRGAVGITDEDVFHVYSKSKVLELIEQGGEPFTELQMRPERFTITNGNSTLEDAYVCPPICIDED